MAEAHPMDVQFARLREAATKAPAGEDILSECLEVAEMLIQKNTAYGNSALDPVRVFSKADAAEQINVRIDDKLSRIRTGQASDTEDARGDLLGYLILERIARRSTISETK